MVLIDNSRLVNGENGCIILSDSLHLVFKFRLLFLSSLSVNFVLIFFAIINSTAEAAANADQESKDNSTTASTAATASTSSGRYNSNTGWLLVDGVLIVAVVTIVEVVAIPIIVNDQVCMRVVTVRSVVVRRPVVSVQR